MYGSVIIGWKVYPYYTLHCIACCIICNCICWPVAASHCNCLFYDEEEQVMEVCLLAVQQKIPWRSPPPSLWSRWLWWCSRWPQPWPPSTWRGSPAGSARGHSETSVSSEVNPPRRGNSRGQQGNIKCALGWLKFLHLQGNAPKAITQGPHKIFKSSPSAHAHCLFAISTFTLKITKIQTGPIDVLQSNLLAHAHC